ncbi:16S rRNA (guanine(527)-N(7))-methyltransferase RsmG [Aureimonas jatrophae]|uniref:Ribosomal RNA small subunit methyltransferase G n=1 Tax=Aureimonas jatrophae TaxID=1166073 RepID=A0A1H0K6T1_9HYPH|nr:16S rRNA (guanine(527)-N(7))-methyltransferase RsmG [Aureimonas jatrophae]MBB3950978.1 16S rRNA (guanine527-N7)-methyltransferase [Aureimonas jatrophae]SDO51685.1 16S rRNA (guanine527-N7)-methyltransferase [Aureimonas jatrophae]
MSRPPERRKPFADRSPASKAQAKKPAPSKPRMGRAATEAKLTEERALVLSRHGVSRETVERLDRFVALLRQWQARINLVSPATVPEIWTRHVEDGLILGQLARRHLRWADIGSGAGLPGLVLAILMAEREGGHVDLIEANAKKAAFLRTVQRELQLPATVHAARIESCGAVLAKVDAVSARALAPLDELLAMTAPHLAPGAARWFLKGRTHEDEIAKAAAQWRLDMVKHPLVEDGSVILEIRSAEPLGAGASPSPAPLS